MNNPKTPVPNRILLVEGKDDEHVVMEIRDRHPSALSFGIENKGGINNVLKSISVEIKAPGRQVVGILVDANSTLMDRWKSVRDRIMRARANIQVPTRPNPDGTIIEGTPRVGIWLMPDNESSGELEDFVKQMIPTGDPVWSLSQQYIDGIPQANRKFVDHKKLRAQLYAWLATREDPRQMGLAIGTGDLNVDGILCKKFVDWLMALFE